MFWIAIGVFALSWLLPFWWWPIPVALLYGMLRAKNEVRGFVAGALGAALSWGLYGYWLQDGEAARIVARMAALLGVNPQWGLLAIAVFMAMVIGGFAASSGFLIGSYWRPAQDGAGPAD